VNARPCPEALHFAECPHCAPHLPCTQVAFCPNYESPKTGYRRGEAAKSVGGLQRDDVMAMISVNEVDRREAFGLIDRLDGLSNVEEITDAMQRFAGCFGFDTLLFTGLPEECFEDAVLATRWPGKFHDLYVREKFIRFDPIAKRARHSNRPFEWCGDAYHSDRDPRTAEVMRRATDFGIARGFVVPIHCSGGYEAAVSMSGVNVDLPPGCKPALHLAALYAFDRVRHLARPEAAAGRPLTPREREVMAWVAQGKSAWEIGEILHITKRTVQEHVVRVFRKLGATNRAQAVAICIRNRLISY